jgi:hypothetical protein
MRARNYPHSLWISLCASRHRGCNPPIRNDFF